MRSNKRSEDSYIVHDIIPLLSEYGYPGAGDPVRVKIKDVPWFRPSGGIGGHMDIVYYHNGEPILLVEAKRKHKTHKFALEEAETYLRNFPTNKKEYAPNGKAPTYIATTVGYEIKFYKHRYGIKKGQIAQYADSIEGIIPFDKLIREYGLIPEYKAIILTTGKFLSDFLYELMAIYDLRKDKLITRDVIKNVTLQILSYLEDPENYTSRLPYVLLDSHKGCQKHIRRLFQQYNLIKSLTAENAEVFRDFALRSFQGGGLNQYMTEHCVIDFMVDMVKPKRRWKIFDFECGSGGFLASVVEKGKIPLENVKGIDIDRLPYVIAKTYLAIYFKKFGKDSINSIPIKNANGLFNYGSNWDLVISNPAGSSVYRRDDLEEVLETLDPNLNLNERNESFSEYNFSVRQAIRSVKIGGKIGLILPEGFFTNSRDEILRKYVIRHCEILAIISLPRGVFKKGKEATRTQKGKQIAPMKMSILYAQKIRAAVDDKEVALNGVDLDYPIFLANVTPPIKRKTEINEWLKPKLNLILEQWRYWKKEGVKKKSKGIKRKIRSYPSRVRKPKDTNR